MEKGIKAVVFDFGNVIINIDLKRTYAAFAELTFKSPEKIKGLFAENEVFKNFEIGKFNEEEFRDVIRQVIGYPLNNAEIDQAWNALLLDVPKDRWSYLEELRFKYPIYLLSNTNITHINQCQKYFKHHFKENNFLSLFKKAFLSYEMGLYKPNYAIYQKVIEEIGCDPEEILFLDDNADNIDAASDMGINAIKIDPPQDFMGILNALL
jgi:glucose-1-phosphatase